MHTLIIIIFRIKSLQKQGHKILDKSPCDKKLNQIQVYGWLASLFYAVTLVFQAFFIVKTN